MKKLSIVAGVVSLLLFQSALAFAHPEPYRVAIENEGDFTVKAGVITYQFDLVDTQNRIVLKDTDLVIDGTKILHLFIYDPALKEFRHEHPQYMNGKWSVQTKLSVNGNYWVWANGKLASDQSEFYGPDRLKIEGGTPENAVPTELGDVRTGTDGNSRVTLSNTVIQAAQPTMLMVNFVRTDGSQPSITPYLGAMAHVVAVTSDADSLAHVHPMSAGQNQLMLHTEFKDAGDYRLWMQYMDGGTLRVVPLSVRVLATQPK